MVLLVKGKAVEELEAKPVKVPRCFSKASSLESAQHRLSTWKPDSAQVKTQVRKTIHVR